MFNTRVAHCVQRQSSIVQTPNEVAQHPSSVTGTESGSKPAQKHVDNLTAGTNTALGEAAGVLAVTAAGVGFGSAKVPAVKALPFSFRALLTAGPPVLWYLYSNVKSSRDNHIAGVAATDGEATKLPAGGKGSGGVI